MNDLTIKAFRSQKAWESRLARNHESAPGLWVKLVKKASVSRLSPPPKGSRLRSATAGSTGSQRARRASDRGSQGRRALERSLRFAEHDHAAGLSSAASLSGPLAALSERLLAFAHAELDDEGALTGDWGRASTTHSSRRPERAGRETSALESRTFASCSASYGGTYASPCRLRAGTAVGSDARHPPRDAPVRRQRARPQGPYVAAAGAARLPFCGAIAQLGERLDRTQEVAGSSPASSIA